MAKSINEYSVKELENIVFNRSLSYTNSTAFQVAMQTLKGTNYPLYKELLYKESIDLGAI